MGVVRAPGNDVARTAEQPIDPADAAAFAPDDPIGRVIRARYRIVRLLGRGAMGNVYEVVHEDLRSSFALKQLRAELTGEPTLRERFRHEAETMARLSHPNVVRVFDVGDEPGFGAWMAMELVRGEDLGAVMHRAGGRLPLATALRIAGEIASALDCAHRAGLVHRDIKPANVLVESHTGRAILTDFGIAKSLAADASLGTETGAFLGTYRYSSPEQIRNLRGVVIDGRADVYSLGVVLYEMTSGRKFLDGWSESQIVSEVGYRADWRAPLPYDEPPPRELLELIERCLAPRREERIASAGEVMRRIAQLAVRVPARDADADVRAASGADASAATPPAAQAAHARATEPTAATVAPAHASPNGRASASPSPRNREASGAQRTPRARPAARRAPAAPRARRWLTALVAVAALIALAALVAPDALRSLVGLETAPRPPRIASAQPADKLIVLTRTEPQWFSAVIDDADPDRPPRMRWYLNEHVVADSTTVWEYDPKVHLPLVTARGKVRFEVGGGKRPEQTRIWATQTSIADLSPVLQAANPKPGSTIRAAVGERIEIDVDAYDPDDSPLTFTWFVDGKRAGGNEPRLVMIVQRDVKIRLVISDGAATVTSGWSVVAEPKPR